MKMAIYSSSKDLLKNIENFPLAFAYNGVDYSGFKKEYFKTLNQEIREQENITAVNLQFSFLDELKINFEWTLYHKSGVSAWRLQIENDGDKPSGIVSNLRSEFTVTGANPFLKGIRGAHYNQYTPYGVSLKDKTEFFESNFGRATHIHAPYFNLEHGDGGVIMTIGWAGTWMARFEGAEKETACMLKAVNNLHTYIKPGEHIISARFVCMSYSDKDEAVVMNRWRKWFVENNLPGSNSQKLAPFITEETANGQLKLYKEEDKIQRFNPLQIGNLDAMLNQNGYNPNWAIFTNNQYSYQTLNNPGDLIINNIADPECYKWTRDRILKQISDNNVSIYFEDSNQIHAPIWQYQDWAEGDGKREGITECKIMEARYTLLEEMADYTAKHGGCGFALYDHEGGGFSDLETLRRAIPINRYGSDNINTNWRLSITSTLNQWLPFCGLKPKEKFNGRADAYIWRSAYSPLLNLTYDLVKEVEESEEAQNYINEWKRISPYLLKDFYVLSPWASSGDVTVCDAFCYHDDESDEGAILFFRREECMEDSIKISLPFLQKDKLYQFEDGDRGTLWQEIGKKLSDGYEISMPDKRSSRIIWFKPYTEENTK